MKVWTEKANALLGKLSPIILIGLVIVLASLSGALRSIDTTIGDLRMGLTPKPVTGEVVFIAIDDQSLKEFGLWPWPRSIHADLLNHLTDVNARDVFFDIDFAFASTAAEDDALLEALERAGGSTYLAAFSQARMALAGDATEPSHNLPYTEFRTSSWPVLVNVPSGRDGLVRHYFFSAPVNGEDLPSAASFLSGSFGPPDGRFLINYGLRPETIPAYSVADVLSGGVPAEALTGKSVVVGAYALELRDNFAVPVHGIIPGAMIHVLATETLMQGVVPYRSNGLVCILLVIAAIGYFQTRGCDFSPWRLIGQSVLVIAGAEVAGLVLFQTRSLLLATGPIYPGLLFYGFWRMGKALDLSHWRIRNTTAEIGNTRRLLEQVFNDSSDMIVVVDERGTILSNSKSADVLTEAPHDTAPRLPDQFVSAVFEAIQAHREGRWLSKGFQETTLGERALQYAVTPSCLEAPRKGRGSLSGRTYIATIAARDVTALRKKEELLTYLSMHDERTGALRRNAFLKIMQDHIRLGNGVAIFAFSLHRFKIINLTLGREIGDLVLKEAVARLSQPANGLSPVVRLDGDSFAIFSLDPVDSIQPDGVAERIKQIVAAPYELGEARAQVGARIGFASEADTTGLTAADLLEQAEEALDEAQKLGGTRAQRHEPAHTSRKTRARAVERAMWTAIERDEFDLVYQPQVRMTDNRLLGVEGLLRWASPELGQVFPDQFIEIAESNGFIQDIGRWVLGRATGDATLLPSDVTVSVNVSALQMIDHDLVSDVQTSLRESGLEARRLWLELTESVFMSPSHSVIETMRDLEMLGVSWALDDFGTGYSSLAYLSKLPLRKLKLDKCFIQALEADGDARAIVRSVSELCEGMGLELVCEGVETEEQVRILLQENCREAQGYFYGKPQTVYDVLDNFCSEQTVPTAVATGT